MIIIDPRNFKSIDQALKAYKQKHNKLGVTKELHSRKEYTKPSVEKRDKLLKAKYIQKLYNSTND